MSLQTEMERGHRAREVIENEVYAEAWAAIESEVIRQWRDARSPQDREQLHQFLLMHEKAKTALESVMRTGQLAEAEIARKQSRAELMIGHLSRVA